MASDTDQSGMGHGHNAPLSGDLPDKPEAWSPKITGFTNTHETDRTDWQPFERQRTTLDPENVEIAERLAARMAEWRQEREIAAASGEEY